MSVILDSCRRTLKLLLFSALASGFLSKVQAHDTSEAEAPISAEATERAVTSLENLFDALDRAGRLGEVRLPDGAVNLAALLGPLEDTVAAADETTVGDSPTLNEALRSAGYEDSPFMIDDWRYETRDVLIHFEQLQSAPDKPTPGAEHIKPFTPRLLAALARVNA